tara:strand:+ start:237 stop:578 length:342 start_codon:yes stop_codon:yes gene_type:complete
MVAIRRNRRALTDIKYEREGGVFRAKRTIIIDTQKILRRVVIEHLRLREMAPRLVLQRRQPSAPCARSQLDGKIGSSRGPIPGRKLSPAPYVRSWRMKRGLTLVFAGNGGMVE